MRIKNKITTWLKNTDVWHVIRKRRILYRHHKVATQCKQLIREWQDSNAPEMLDFRPLKENLNKKIIWQYWAQGYDNVPKVVRECLDSVDRWKGDCLVVRLSDDNLDEYVQLPSFILEKKENGIISLAHFSDILRLCLLSTYGGLWLDATVFISGDIPSRYFDVDFFVFQRDPNEKNIRYWERTYAYYFGWDKGFRVRMLNSIYFSNKDSIVTRTLTNILLYHWKYNNRLPDYFYFQVLFDVLIKGVLKGNNCIVESDCQPHYLQQFCNDKNFSIMSKENILSTIPFHKLTYK